MAAARSSQTTTPGVGGAALELAQTAGGAWVPSAYLRALDPSDNLIELKANTAGRLQVEDADAADITTSAALAASLAAATLDVSALPRGVWSVYWPAGTFNMTLSFEVSMDGGTTWGFVIGTSVSTVGVANAVQLTTTNSSQMWTGTIPAGATHIRARSGPYTSGTLNAKVSASARGAAPTVAVVQSLPPGSNTIGTVALGNGTQNIGSVSLIGVAANSAKSVIGAAWATYWLDTTTNLAIGATFTGTARDLIGTTTGNDSPGKPQEFRALATADVTGTLYLEVSRDSTTWRRVGKFVTTQPDASLWVAEFEKPVIARYARVVYVNGATAQAAFVIESLALAA